MLSEFAKGENMTFEDYEVQIELPFELFKDLRERGIIRWDRYLGKWQFHQPGFITLRSSASTVKEEGQ